MSGTDGTSARRVTAGYLAKILPAQVNESFNGLVTLTSIATNAAEVSPGALFIPGPAERDEKGLRTAFERGAYAFALPETERGNPVVKSLGLPALFARDLESSVGKLAAYIEGDPSQTLAVFTIFGPQAQPTATKLAGLLHILGNSVALVSKAKSFSLDRSLSFKFPIDAVRLQQFEAVTLEEGAAALILACDEETLAPLALVGTQIDVSADTTSAALPIGQAPAWVAAASPARLGATFGKQTHKVSPGMFASELNSLNNSASLSSQLIDPPMALSISMALAAGITVGSIGQALQVSEEFS